MLTRRGFTGIASCAICAAAGFIATDASAQSAPPPAVPGIKRKILSQMDGPMPGYVTINMEVEIDPGVTVARHTHPGIESSYVLEGGFELPGAGSRPSAPRSARQRRKPDSRGPRFIKPRQHSNKVVWWG